MTPKPIKNPKPNKKETTIERGNSLDSEIPEWLQKFRKIWWMMKFQYTETLTPVLLMKLLWSRLQRYVRIWVSTVLRLICLKIEIAKSVKRTKITRAPCRRRNGEAVPRAEKIGDLITADHKVLSDNCESRNNHRYAVVVQDLATQWIQAYPCKTKISQETERSLQKFRNPIRNQKSFTLTIPWNSAKPVKISPESLHVYTTPIGDSWDF